MTELQSIMLSVCFGTVVGYFISSIVIIVKYAIEDHREKKRKRKENGDKQYSERAAEGDSLSPPLFYGGKIHEHSRNRY